MVIRTRTEAIKEGGEAKGKEIRKKKRKGKRKKTSRKICLRREIERERKTKGNPTGTREYPIVASIIAIVTLMTKEINCLCFPL